MEVKRIADYRSRETVAVLTHLLERAKRGELNGVALCALPVAGHPEILFTDLCRRDPHHALRTALRLSRRANELSDQIQDGTGS